MKTYNQLTEEEKKNAVSKALDDEFKAILEYGVRYNDSLNGDDLQARIDKCIEKAEKKKTPWFVNEYLADDKIVMEALQGLAQCRAEDSLYAESNEYVVYGVASKGKQ